MMICFGFVCALLFPSAAKTIISPDSIFVNNNFKLFSTFLYCRATPALQTKTSCSHYPFSHYAHILPGNRTVFLFSPIRPSKLKKKTGLYFACLNLL